MSQTISNIREDVRQDVNRVISLGGLSCSLDNRRPDKNSIYQNRKCNKSRKSSDNQFGEQCKLLSK